MKKENAFLGIFDDEVLNPNGEHQSFYEVPQTPSPKAEEMDQFGMMKMVLTMQREREGFEKKAAEILQNMEQVVQKLEAVKDFKLKLDANDIRLLDQLPLQVVNQTTKALDDYLPREVEHAISEIKDIKENACKEIHEIRELSEKGIWISNSNLYIVFVIVLMSISFGGWGVSQLGEPNKTYAFWTLILLLPLYLGVKWLITEKIFPKDNLKYPWR